MLKKTSIIVSVLLLSACHPIPTRIPTGAHVDCARLKHDLNVDYRRHTPGSNINHSISAGQRASAMQLYEKDCTHN